MGVKAWFIAYFDDYPKKSLAGEPKLDRVQSRELVGKLFPGADIREAEDGTLGFLNPDEGQALVGCYGDVRIVAHDALSGDYPSKIPTRWLDPSLGRTVYLHAQHSVTDWFAFGLWRDGRLVRSLSVSPDNGILEQIGEPLEFERPYWSGQFPAGSTYPLPFHPLELSEACVRAHLGFQFEGSPVDCVVDPDEVPIASFSFGAPKVSRPRWKFW